jgi:regulator of replication initiation timing
MIDKDNQIKALVSEIHNIKKDFAFKLEEIQALYMENKKQSKIIEDLHKENKHLKQQIKKLNQEAEEMITIPMIVFGKPIHRKHSKWIVSFLSIVLLLIIL